MQVERSRLNLITPMLGSIYDPHLVNHSISEGMDTVITNNDSIALQGNSTITSNAIYRVNRTARYRREEELEGINPVVAHILHENIIIAGGRIMAQITVTIRKMKRKEGGVLGKHFNAIRGQGNKFQKWNRGIAGFFTTENRTT